MSAEELKILQEFNSNVDWLRKNQKSVPFKNEPEEWIELPEAMSILHRSRTWVRTRMQDEIVQPINVNWFLFKGVDWSREGNRLVFKRSSIVRLKEEMRKCFELATVN